MPSSAPLYEVQLAGPVPATLGESPLWHPAEQRLYYVDIAERQLLRLDPVDGALDRWALDGEPGCIALADDGLLIAQRDGLWHFNPVDGVRRRLAPPPYDPAGQRFNDGKPDAQGRLWVGTIDDARQPRAALYRFADGAFTEMAGDIVTSNGLAWSPDQRRLYWADTKAHEIYKLDFDAAGGTLGTRELFVRFEPRAAGQSLDDYGGRPDGAAVDAEGCYWVAMFEGQRLLRFSPEGALLREIRLPVRCPTMPTFGDADLRTLYVTTAREKRPVEELAAQPWAGCVLKLRVDVPGKTPHLARP